MPQPTWGCSEKKDRRKEINKTRKNDRRKKEI
jgi:hypothetical protein